MVLSWKVKVLKSYGCKTQETIFFNLVLKYLLSCFEKPYFLIPHLVFKTQEPHYWLMSLQVRISDYPISDQISPHHYPLSTIIEGWFSSKFQTLWTSTVYDFDPFLPFLIFSPDPKVNHKEWVRRCASTCHCKSVNFKFPSQWQCCSAEYAVQVQWQSLGQGRGRDLK